MKNKFVIIFALGLFFTANQPAFAYFFCSPNFYLAGSTSIEWHTNHHFPDSDRFSILGNKRTYKYGGGANISLGYIFDELYKQWDLRIEGEIVYKRNALSKIQKNLSAVGRTQDIALMANVFTDIPLWYCLDLNVGAGIGISFNELKLASVNGFPIFPDIHHDEILAWQVLCGITVNLFPDVALTAGYRLFGTEKVRTPHGIKCKELPLTQCLDFGMRFRL
jgi:opacity protein-like surface antigen